VNGEVWKKVVQKKNEEDLTGPTLLVRWSEVLRLDLTTLCLSQFISEPRWPKRFARLRETTRCCVC
jgi:hypothetical protein